MKLENLHENESEIKATANAFAWTVAYLSDHGISRQMELPLSLNSGDLPNPEIKPGSPIMETDALPSESQKIFIV